jgi:hypothetical protein
LLSFWKAYLCQRRGILRKEKFAEEYVSDLNSIIGGVYQSIVSTKYSWEIAAFIPKKSSAKYGIF